MVACLSAKADIDTLRTLIDGGADVNARVRGADQHGHPMLALALGKSCIGKIRLLIERGADVSPEIEHGCTLLTRTVLTAEPDGKTEIRDNASEWKLDLRTHVWTCLD